MGLSTCLLRRRWRWQTTTTNVIPSPIPPPRTNPIPPQWPPKAPLIRTRTPALIMSTRNIMQHPIPTTMDTMPTYLVKHLVVLTGIAW